MNQQFEVEYDGTVYEVDAEYSLTDASYTDEFGTVPAMEADVTAWYSFVDGAEVTITDEKLRKLIWLEADKRGADVVAASLSDC